MSKHTEGTLLSVSGAYDQHGCWPTITAYVGKEERQIVVDMEPKDMEYAKEIARRWNAHEDMLSMLKTALDWITPPPGRTIKQAKMDGRWFQNVCAPRLSGLLRAAIQKAEGRGA